jgi:pSer/pThr/pTyr-binding forkhead associated (FHA) protein
MRNFRRLIIVLTTIALFVIPSAGLVAAQGSANLKFFITSIDNSSFPDVSLKVRAVDTNDNSLSSLSSNQIRIFEDNSEVNLDSVNILSAEKGPAAVIFLIDMGKYSRNALSSTRLKVLLNYYMNEYFRDGIDSVAIYSRGDDGQNVDKNITILRPTHSQSELKYAIDHIQMVRSNISSSVLSGVETAPDDMTVFLNGQAGRASTALIVISAYNETASPDMVVLTNDLRAKNITGYAIYTYENTTRMEDFKQFADMTGGQLVRVPSSGETTPANTTIMYDEIYSRNQLINLKYRSSYGQSGNRKVSIVNANETVERTADNNTYMVALNDPQITLKNAPVDSIKVGAPLNLTVELGPWGDSIERQLVKAELFIDSELEATLPAADNQVALTSPINFTVATDKLSPGTHTVDITVTDELGLKGSITPVNITVTRARVEPTSPPPTPTPAPNCATKPFNPDCAPTTTVVIAVVLIGFVGLLVALLVFLMLRTNRRMGAVMQKSGSLASGGFEEMKTALYGRQTPGDLKSGNPLAKMHILVAGMSLENQVIDIYSNTTSFGRNPQKCDHQLYTLTDRSTVSGLHCTITYDYGKFLLTDDNSQNGTFVGGKALTPNEPYELSDGDEIVLGVPTIGGAKMRFEIVDRSKVFSRGDNSEEGDPDHTELGLHLPDNVVFEPKSDKSDRTDKTDILRDIIPPEKGQKKKTKSNDDWMDELK